MLISRTPHRISFGGGGTDLEDYYLEHGGCALSVTIDRYFYASIESRDEPGVRIASADYKLTEVFADPAGVSLDHVFKIPLAVLRHFGVNEGVNIFMASEVPAGTGLGSSCAVSVGLVNLLAAFLERPLTAEEAAEAAFYIDTRVLRFPIGKQDQYASAFGGLNYFRFEEGGSSVERVVLPEDTLSLLDEDTMLFFSGMTRKASDVLSEQRAATRNGDSVVIDSLNEIKKLAGEMRRSLEEGDLRRFGGLLNESWEQKRRLAGNVSNPEIDRAYETALANGALGGKICGAGGGGFLLLYCDEGQVRRLTEAMAAIGWQEYDHSFDSEGSIILEG